MAIPNFNLSSSIPNKIQGPLARIYLKYRNARNSFLINNFPSGNNLKPIQATKTFSSLRRKIEELAVHIDRDYCFLDLPEYGNIGDHMIYKGSQEFLETLPHKCNYKTSFNSFQASEVGSDDLILLQGGGNFGDLWARHQEFREQIVRSFNKNKIIILPQTIFFQNKNNLVKAVSTFSEHPDLTICVRDQRSYEVGKRHFTNNKVLLLPDMASYLNLEVEKSPSSSISRVLYIKRTDKEFNDSYNIPSLNTLTISDWPTYEKKYFNFLPDKFRHSDLYLNEGILFISNFDLVITSRLHGGIMAALLGIPVIFLDNSYGKNKSYFTTWLKDIQKCFLARNQKELGKILEEHFPKIMN